MRACAARHVTYELLERPSFMFTEGLVHVHTTASQRPFSTVVIPCKSEMLLITLLVLLACCRPGPGNKLTWELFAMLTNCIELHWNNENMMLCFCEQTGA